MKFNSVQKQAERNLNHERSLAPAIIRGNFFIIFHHFALPPAALFSIALHTCSSSRIAPLLILSSMHPFIVFLFPIAVYTNSLGGFVRVPLISLSARFFFQVLILGIDSLQGLDAAGIGDDVS